MRSGGYHQNSFHRHRPWEHNGRNIRERFVKDVLKSGAEISVPDSNQIRTTVQKIKSDYGTTIFIVDTSAVEPNIFVDNDSFNAFMQEYGPQIAHIRKQEEGKISKLFEKPNPLEIIGLGAFIQDSEKRERAYQSARTLGKNLAELTSTQTQTNGPFFSPPQTQEEIEQKIDFTTHYQSQVLSEYRSYLKDILEHIKKRKLPFEFDRIGRQLITRLLDLPHKIRHHGCWRARELTFPEDWNLLFYAALNLHITEQDTTVLTRDGAIIDVIKYIRRHRLWEEGQLLEGFSNLDRLYAATIDRIGNLKYIVGPQTTFATDANQTQQTHYNQSWRLPDYIRKQQQQKLEQLIDQTTYSSSQPLNSASLFNCCNPTSCLPSLFIQVG